MHEDTATWVVHTWIGKVQTFVLKIFCLNNFCSNQFVSKVSESIKKVLSLKISRQNNSNKGFTKELDKDESYLKKLSAKHPKNILFGQTNVKHYLLM